MPLAAKLELPSLFSTLSETWKITNEMQEGDLVNEDDNTTLEDERTGAEVPATFYANTMLRARENVWTIVGWTIALLFGVYQLTDARVEPDLQVLFDLSSAAKLVTTANPDIKVSYRGLEVEGEVSSQVIRFWNRGKHSIEAPDILAPVQLRAVDNVRLLNVQVKQQTREIVGAVATIVDQKTIKLDWKILEATDGVSLQVLYQGAATAKFQVEGAIRGQKTISSIFLDRNDERKPKANRFLSGLGPTAKFFAMLAGVVIILFVVAAGFAGFHAITYFVLQTFIPKKRVVVVTFYVFLTFTIVCLLLLLASEAGLISHVLYAMPDAIK